jgi:hypothetical protein
MGDQLQAANWIPDEYVDTCYDCKAAFTPARRYAILHLGLIVASARAIDIAFGMIVYMHACIDVRTGR